MLRLPLEEDDCITEPSRRGGPIFNGGCNRRYVISIDEIENIFVAIDSDSEAIEHRRRDDSIDLVSYIRSIQSSENIVSILHLALTLITCTLSLVGSSCADLISTRYECGMTSSRIGRGTGSERVRKYGRKITRSRKTVPAAPRRIQKPRDRDFLHLSQRCLLDILLVR
jgi:hypothetical protein